MLTYWFQLFSIYFLPDTLKFMLYVLDRVKESTVWSKPTFSVHKLGIWLDDRKYVSTCSYTASTGTL